MHSLHASVVAAIDIKVLAMNPVAWKFECISCSVRVSSLMKYLGRRAKCARNMGSLLLEIYVCPQVQGQLFERANRVVASRVSDHGCGWKLRRDAAADSRPPAKPTFYVELFNELRWPYF